MLAECLPVSYLREQSCATFLVACVCNTLQIVPADVRGQSRVMVRLQLAAVIVNVSQSVLVTAAYGNIVILPDVDNSR